MHRGDFVHRGTGSERQCRDPKTTFLRSAANLSAIPLITSGAAAPARSPKTMRWPAVAFRRIDPCPHAELMLESSSSESTCGAVPSRLTIGSRWMQRRESPPAHILFGKHTQCSRSPNICGPTSPLTRDRTSLQQSYLNHSVYETPLTKLKSHRLRAAPNFRFALLAMARRF